MFWSAGLQVGGSQGTMGVPPIETVLPWRRVFLPSSDCLSLSAPGLRTLRSETRALAECAPGHPKLARWGTGMGCGLHPQ